MQTVSLRRLPLLISFLTVLSGPLRAQEYLWTTFAGNTGGAGSNDGPGLEAHFSSPYSAAMDAAGNCYVVEKDNHTLRKITPEGDVTTLAGSAGVSGSADGSGSAARFNEPSGITVDATGIIYVADSGNHTVRRVTAAGAVSTLAGSPGVKGAGDGTGSAALFDQPIGLATDGPGNLYVADFNNQTIRRITPGGVVTTFAGTAGSKGSTNGTGAAARFNYPRGLARDLSGNLYVAEKDNHTIRKITPAGVVSTFAGTALSSGTADGTGAAARFNQPRNVAVDGSGNVYVADTGNQTIRKITPAGLVTTLAGGAGSSGYLNGNGTVARFNAPYGVAVDASGNVRVADSGNNAIRRITAAGAVTTLHGGPAASGSTNGTGTAARFNRPACVAVDATGNLYVADQANYLLRKITPAGVVSTLAGSPGVAGAANGTGSAALFAYLSGLAVAPDGTIYVSEGGNSTIRRVTPGGTVTTIAGSAGTSGSADGTGTAARFGYPGGLAVDSTGNVFICDTSYSTIRRMTPAGVVTTIAGSPGMHAAVNGTGSAARFYNPQGLAIDESDNLYVADYRNHLIRRVTPAGEVTTVAGGAGLPGSDDGFGEEARFNMPMALTVDGFGNLFVADESNHAIRMITPEGDVTTIGGLPGFPSIGGGMGENARFNLPRGIIATPSGDLYVGDFNNQRIVRGRFIVPDTSTDIPILNTPVSNAVTGDAVPFIFILPETALPGSVKLQFTGAVTRTLTLSQTAAATHSFNLSAANPASSPGVTDVSGGPTIPYGTYAVTLSYQDATGNAAASVTATNITLSPLAAWKLSQLGDAFAADDGDADGDGLANLDEYALLQPPGTSGVWPVSAAAFAYPGEHRLRLVVPRDPARSEVNLFVEASGELGGPWTTLASSTGGSPFAGPGYVGGDSPAPGVKSVEIRDIFSIEAVPRRFLRVRVSRN